jgi:hypothetical protein
MAQQPRSELARYAFGYSDKKPGPSYWIVQLSILAFCVYFVGPKLVQIEWADPAPTGIQNQAAD